MDSNHRSPGYEPSRRATRVPRIELVPKHGIEPWTLPYQGSVLPLYYMGELVVPDGIDPSFRNYQFRVLPLNYRTIEGSIRRFTEISYPEDPATGVDSI